jgi:toxin CptA
MHNAPSVSYPVGRSRFSAGVLLLIWLVAAVAIARWWAQVQAPGWRVGAAALLLVCAGLWAAWNWAHSPVGSLAWNGAAWNWASRQASEEGEPEVSLDLQRWLLLRWSSDQRIRWFWVERGRGVERWDDLRRAVYSRASPRAPGQAEPPAAKS